MKTKHILIGSFLCILSLGLNSCIDYLTEQEPGSQMLKDYFNNGKAAEGITTGCYVPLMWEYNNTYYSEWFIGDVVSDDALKGGQNVKDMDVAGDMENWRTTASNTLILDFYRAQYQGIARCNLALKYIPETPTDSLMDESMRQRFIGEVKYLRAYYYFRLLRVYGGVPLSLKVIDSSEDWNMPRASVEQIYSQIVADLKDAQSTLWVKSKYPAGEEGRVTKGAAEAMLMKVHLYMASPYWSTYLKNSTRESNLEAAKAWGDSIIGSGEYELVSNYADNFTLEGENGPESVFEIQYAEEGWGDFGSGNGFTSGTFTTRLTRSRSTKLTNKDAGWGFNRPTQNLYDEFEAGDARRDVAILNPTDDQLKDENGEINSDNFYFGIRYLNNKTGLYGYKLDHHSRGPLNKREIRYSDVLLMYAEVAAERGDAATAETYLNKVREARGMAAYTATDYYTTTTPSTGDKLKDAIRHERRVELAMESHRWYDLVRWYGGDNGLDNYMNVIYKNTESELAQNQMAAFRKGVNEIFPIPEEEFKLNLALQGNQNPGY